MLQMKPTENLTGITIQGDYNDLYELMESIYRMTGLEEDRTEIYYGIKNRLLGLCYDIRHAFMGDREVVFEENGICEEVMKWHKIIAPTHNVYYSVNVLFPEAIFIAASVPNIYYLSYRNYGINAKHTETGDYQLPSIPVSYYSRDKAILDVLCAEIWQVLGEVIGDEELEKLIRLMNRAGASFAHYVIQYIDKCNIELLKTDVEKRKDKLRNIAKRIVKKNQTYMNMERDLQYWAKEYNTTIYELEDPGLQYPENIEW